MIKKIFGFFLQIIKNVIFFLYCKRDKIQQGTEKLLNVWIYEIIAIFGLISASCGLAFGASDSTKAGMVGVGPLTFTFVINLFIIFNYFMVMKRATEEEVKLHLPQNIRKGLIVNMIFGGMLPLGVFAKGKLYRHYVGLYKKRMLPGANPDDSGSAKRKRLKEAKLAAQQKNKEAKMAMKAPVKNQTSQVNQQQPKVAPTPTVDNTAEQKS